MRVRPVRDRGPHQQPCRRTRTEWCGTSALFATIARQGGNRLWGGPMTKIATLTIALALASLAWLVSAQPVHAVDSPPSSGRSGSRSVSRATIRTRSTATPTLQDYSSSYLPRGRAPRRRRRASRCSIQSPTHGPRPGSTSAQAPGHGSVSDPCVAIDDRALRSVKPSERPDESVVTCSWFPCLAAAPAASSATGPPSLTPYRGDA